MVALALTLQKQEQVKMVVLMWSAIVEAININSRPATTEKTVPWAFSVELFPFMDI